MKKMAHKIMQQIMSRERFGEEYHEENKSCTGCGDIRDQHGAVIVEYGVTGGSSAGTGQY